jgi:hypothetical protein
VERYARLARRGDLKHRQACEQDRLQPAQVM